MSLVAAPAGAQELIGFHADRVEAQREIEQRADDWIVADELLEWNRLMTPRPHHAGAPQTEANARWMVERFREWGFEAGIETFDVLFPTPRLRSLTLLEPTRFEASLVEEAAAGDGTAEVAMAEGLPPFNAFSADGDVTGELVYVNRGVPEDYEVLDRLGIDVRGKIGDRPLRRLLARNQAEGRLRARRQSAASSSTIRATTATARALGIRRGSFKHASAVAAGFGAGPSASPGRPADADARRRRRGAAA